MCTGTIQAGVVAAIAVGLGKEGLQKDQDRSPQVLDGVLEVYAIVSIHLIEN